MKNAKLLAKIAKHIKTVPECNTTYGVLQLDTTDKVCMIANAHKAGIIDFKTALKIQFEEGFAEHFDVPQTEAERVLYYDDHTRFISGELYYDLCKELLEKYGHGHGHLLE